MEIHIGNLIRAHIKAQGKTLTYMRSELGLNKRQLEYLLSCPSIDTLTLYQISKKLNHDFFSHYSHSLNSLSLSPTQTETIRQHLAAIEKIISKK